jgi:uncharacterized lipoprotein
MNSFSKAAMWALFLVAASGCAFQKQAIKLQPTVNVPASEIGTGKAAMISVADERPRGTLGTRGVAGIGEQLTIEGDLVATIKAAVSEGLVKNGFAVDGPADNQLRVEIRNLDYVLSSGFWAGKLNIEFLIKGICIKGNLRPYEQVYRGEFRKNIQVVQGDAANNAYVNQAVSQAVNALASDTQLLRCLAQ